MNLRPKISVITVCYNAEQTIEQTIQSVINQTYDNIEYIIIDGASTDRTMEIVDKYRRQISKVISEPDKGIYDAFNKAIYCSTGDYLYFLNADDQLFKNEVLVDISSQLQETNADVLYGAVEYIELYNGKPYVWKDKIDLKKVMQGHMPHHQGTFFRKTIFDKFGVYNTRYSLAADYEFTTRYFSDEAIRIQKVDDIVAKFRMGGVSTSITSSAKETWGQEKEKIVRELYQFEVQKNPLQENYDLLKIWINLLINVQEFDVNEMLQGDIAVFGAGDISALIIDFISKRGMTPCVVFDNDPYLEGKLMKNIVIKTPKKLENINTIIIATEANHEQSIRKQLEQEFEEEILKINIYTWKDIVLNLHNKKKD
ncbi:glycosyltransferase family 2 protein [Paenibacillus sp. strain BS8-2]